MSEIAREHASLTAEFTRLAEGVTDWDAPTPVVEWRTRDIVSHLTGWVPGFLRSRGVEVPEVATATDDPLAEWRDFTRTMQALLDDPAWVAQPVESGMSEVEATPLGQTLSRIYLPDVLMHTWDLAKASGQQPRLDPTMVEGLVGGMIAMKQMLADSGQFGTPVVLDETHPPVERMAAIIGRDPHWTPPQA